MNTSIVLGAYITGIVVGLLAAGLAAALIWSWLTREMDDATTLPDPAGPETQPIPLDLTHLIHGEWTA